MTADSAIPSGQEATILTDLLALFRSHPHFLLTSHASPDGDAVGSVLGLAGLLHQMGVTTEIVLADPVPQIYRSLPGVEQVRHSFHGTESAAPAILLECDVDRCGLKDLSGRLIINIDHHASARPFGDLNWIDETACAVAAMVCSLAQEAHRQDPAITITPAMATCLYTAILTDTGAFTYAATDARTFALAEELSRAGANPSNIAREIYFSNPFSKVRLLGVALRNLQREGPIAWTTLSRGELEEVGASSEECEGIVNYLIGIDGIEAAVFLRESPESPENSEGSGIRVSLRSKGSLDVAKVAEQFGGGGHRVASGCTLTGPIPLATESVLASLRQRLC